MAREDFQNRSKKSIAERKFISETLTDTGRSLVNDHLTAANKFTTKRSGGLTNKLKFSVSKKGSAGAELNLEHAPHQRFLDMRKTSRSGRRFKRRHLHNKILFGHLSPMIKRLMYGFTEEVQTVIKQGLKQEDYE